MTKSSTLILVASVLVALALMGAGCVGAIRGFVLPSPTPAPTPASATPLSIVTATPKPTPLATTPTPHVDLIYARPLEAGASNNTSCLRVLTGTITYNGDPANAYTVLVDTVEGCEYGNKTRPDGGFQVAFMDDGSPTYVMKVVDTSGIVIYADNERRPVNQTGPFVIEFDVPSSKQISVTITPPVL